MKRFSTSLICLVLLLPAIGSKAQNSGSGTINNYLINCMTGPNCEDTSNPHDSLIITAPEDGELKITVTLMNGSVNCCTPELTFSQIVTARLFILNSANPIWFFVNNTTSSYTRSCVKKDDQFLLVFAGSKGDYSYMTEFFPSDKANDDEPNDIPTQAKYLSADADHEGRIGYGTYQDDLNDWYKVVAAENGKLKVDINTDAGANFYLVHYLGSNVIDQALMAAAGVDSLIANCVATNDTFYLRVAARSNICADYTLHYSTIFVDGTQDMEPNNMISEATEITADTDIEGLIGFGYYGTDVGDYYKLTSDTSGNLEIRLEFDYPINVRLYRFSNQQQILFKLALMGGKDTLRIPCVEQGDMFFLKIEKDNPECTRYSVNYTIVDPPPYPADEEYNNTTGTATEVLNLPGNFTGNVGYGYYVNDQTDYFFLGLMEVNDRLVFNFDADPGSVNIQLERVNFGAILEKDFGQISGMKLDSFTITTAGLYFLKITSNNCNSYSVDIGGTLSHVKINGVDAMSAHSALLDVKVTNSIAGPNTLICTKELIICPVFTVPLGYLFEVKIIP